MDEFREEREALKHGTPKQKLEYFWDYYKWHTIGGIIAVILIVSIVYNAVTAKDCALYAVFLNSYTEQRVLDSFVSGFTDTTDIDTDKYEVIVDTNLSLSEDARDEASYAAVQKIMALIAASNLDILAGDTASFNRYAYNDMLTDLRDILSPQQQQLYEPYYYYVDRAVILAQQEAYNNLNVFEEEYPDPTKPEEMKDPIPVGLFTESSEALAGHFIFTKKPVAIGILVNTEHQDLALQFLDYIFR